MIKAIVVDFSGTLWTGTQINEDLFTYLQKYRNKYKLYIFTSSRPLNLPGMNEKLEDLFIDVIVSMDLGYYKQDSRAYIKLSELIDISTDEIVFIDDSESKISAADEAGVKTIRFENNNQVISQLDQVLAYE